MSLAETVPGEMHPDMDVRLRRTVEGVIGVPATEGNRIEVLRNGDEIFPAMLDAICGAQHTIDMLTFVYWEGEVGTKFAKALADRARQGARVRVLLDAWGSKPIERDLVDVMQRSGVIVRWFRPLRRFRLGEINHRTHRKVLIVDEAVAFTGGVGIADEWQGDARNANEWRDTHFRIEGPAVDGLRAAFLDNWAETDPTLFDDAVDRFPDQPKPGDSVVQCVRGASEAGHSDVYTLFRALCQRAEKRIRLTTAYFVPDEEMTTRLVDA
ncbi:MAG TPA: phospholipase D-like domain-containing protein, partial [Acidimicrobiia bacterium]|nr:phospholipase D-like domain-containing protein [Acidimicrobiia bacterium]